MIFASTKATKKRTNEFAPKEFVGSSIPYFPPAHLILTIFSYIIEKHVVRKTSREDMDSRCKCLFFVLLLFLIPSTHGFNNTDLSRRSPSNELCYSLCLAVWSDSLW